MALRPSCSTEDSAASLARPILLLIGHAASPTGFARVLHALAVHLAEHFEVHLFATYLCEEASFTNSYTLHRQAAGTDDPAALANLHQELAPDVCLLLDEPSACASRIALLRGLGHRSRILAYCAADEPAQLTKDILSQLALADCVIAFTRQAHADVLQAFASSSIAPPEIAVIPHGVELATFYPVPRAEARERLFPHQPELQNAFLVLNANRNQAFKRVDLTLRGFALFAEGKPPGVKLYLHMASRAPISGERPLAERLNLGDRLLTPAAPTSIHPHLQDAELNLLYNTCDVGINTADREGWGLVSFEHAAVGAPQIVPGLATMRELWGEAAVILPTTLLPSAQIPGRIAPTVRPEDVAAALECLYRDPIARARLTEAGRKNTQQPSLRWNNIACQWTELICRCLRPTGSLAEPHRKQRVLQEPRLRVGDG